MRIAAGRRAPAHMGNLRVLRGKIRGEHLEPDIDHARGRGEQVAPSGTVIVSHRCCFAIAPCARSQFTCRITLPTLSKISPISFSEMISGGESAMVSPVMRNSSPCSWKARSIES
jgi:hypothetical protein